MRQRWLTLKHNAYQWLISVDQCCNTTLSFLHSLLALVPCVPEAKRAWGDESLSSVSYRLWRDGVSRWQMRFIDVLFFWDTRKAADGRTIRHCEDAYIGEREGRQRPPELRGE